MNSSQHFNTLDTMLCMHSRPMEDDPKAKSKEPADAAALIAEALKRKFAHRYRTNSGQDDKDEFTLPVPEAKPQTETPMVRSAFFKAGRHILRERKFMYSIRRHLFVVIHKLFFFSSCLHSLGSTC